MLEKYFKLGITDQLNAYEVFKLQIVNRMVVCCVFLDMILVLINLIIGNYLGIAIDVAALCLILIPVLWLNARHQYQAAVWLFLFGLHVSVTAGGLQSIVESRDNEVENMLIAGAIAIIILLTGSQQVISFLFNLILILFLNFQRYRIQQGQVDVDYLKLAAILMVIYLGIFYFIGQFKSQLTRALKDAQHLNMKLQKKEKSLKALNKSKNRLFSIVAHDLRAPLHLIHGLLDPDISQYMEKDELLSHQLSIRSRIGVLQESINNLLNWSRSQLNKFKIAPVVVDLQHEVNRVTELFTELIERKRLVINVDIEKEAKAIADKDHINIILRNIFHNAIKFTPNKGKIEVLVVMDSNFAHISISDSGSGMNENVRTRVLKGQLMESGSGTEGERGSGVGLSFTRELIERNRSILEIIDRPIGGTIFKVSIPRHFKHKPATT